MEIDREKISLAEKMSDILEQLQEQDGITLEDLLINGVSRRHLVYAFLALLELVKMGFLRIYQGESFGVIRIFLKVT
ncbi:MAG: hypothetical protein U1C55_09255, partial [Smithellaceae bacterium]|nr:hypothetical protein [Smithellaceae bacterium]